MVNALQELSNAPEGKYVNGLSRAICVFLLSYYKDDGNLSVLIIFFLFINLIQFMFSFLLTGGNYKLLRKFFLI